MSPRPSVDRPAREPDRSSGLSLTQIAASAAAAASAAFAASFLGVAGTIIGAAVASVIATVATTMYSASLQRSREAMRRTAGQFGAPWVVPVGRDASAAEVRAASHPLPGAAETQVLEPPVVLAPEPPRESGGPDRPWAVRWGRVLPTAAAVLVLALGALTAVEAVFGKPLSALLDGSDREGTSLSTVTGNGGPAEGREPSADRPVDGPASPSTEPTPTVQPTAEPEPTAEPTAEPTEEPTGEPTEEAPDPTETPTPAPSGTD